MSAGAGALPTRAHARPPPRPRQACAMGFGLLRPIPLIIYFIRDRLAGTEKAK